MSGQPQVSSIGSTKELQSVDSSGMSAVIKKNPKDETAKKSSKTEAVIKAAVAVKDDIKSSFVGSGKAFVGGFQLAGGIMSHYWGDQVKQDGSKTTLIGRIGKDVTTGWHSADSLKAKIGKDNLSVTKSIKAVGSDMSSFKGLIEKGWGKINTSMPTKSWGDTIGRFFAKAGLIAAAAIGTVVVGFASVVGRGVQAMAKGVVKGALTIPGIKHITTGVIGVATLAYKIGKTALRFVGPPIAALGAIAGGIVVSAAKLTMGFVKIGTLGLYTAAKAGITHLRTGQTAKSMNTIGDKLKDMGIKVEKPPDNLTVFQKCKKIYNIAMTDVWGLKSVDKARGHVDKGVNVGLYTDKVVNNFSSTHTAISTTSLTLTAGFASGSGVMTVADGGMKVGKAIYRLYSGEELKSKINAFIDPVAGKKALEEKLKEINKGTTFSKGIDELDTKIKGLEKSKEGLDPVKDEKQLGWIQSAIDEATGDLNALKAVKLDCENTIKVLDKLIENPLDEKTKASLKQLSSRVGTDTNIGTLLEGSALMVGGVASTIGSIATIASGTTTTLLAAGAGLTVGALSASGFGLAVIGAGMLVGAGVTAYKVDKVLEREEKIGICKEQLKAVNKELEGLDKEIGKIDLIVAPFRKGEVTELQDRKKELTALKEQIEINLCRVDPETAKTQFTDNKIKLPQIQGLEVSDPKTGDKTSITPTDVMSKHIFGKKSSEVEVSDFPIFTGLHEMERV
jgi:hypothetical protein